MNRAFQLVLLGTFGALLACSLQLPSVQAKDDAHIRQMINQRRRQAAERQDALQDTSTEAIDIFDGDDSGSLEGDELSDYRHATNPEYRAMLFWDMNADGKLEEMELDRARLENSMAKEMQVLAADNNKDGIVDEQERNERVLTQVTSTIELLDKLENKVKDADIAVDENLIRAIRMRLDRNGDGSWDEAETAMVDAVIDLYKDYQKTLLQEELRSLLARFDQNGNGTLEDPEKEEVGKTWERRFQDRLRGGRLRADERAMLGSLKEEPAED